MNKAELKDVIQKSLECSAAQAERTINSVFEGIVEGLHKDGTVQVMGFGTFVVKNRSARVGRNPTTGQPIQIPASRTVSFRAGKALKDGLMT